MLVALWLLPGCLATPDLYLTPGTTYLFLQANKNLLLKGKVGTAGVSAALALKAWWQPSFWLALALGYGFKDGKPRVGLTAGLENYGNIRWDRVWHCYVMSCPADDCKSIFMCC